MKEAHVEWRVHSRKALNINVMTDNGQKNWLHIPTFTNSTIL